jgi:hypothetical protein
VLFLLGLRKDNGIFILFSGIVTGLAALTKTNALPLYFLFGPCLILKRKWRFLLLWCIPAILLPLIWVGHNIIVYKKIQYISIGWFGLSPGDVRYRIERFVSYAGGALMLPVSGTADAGRRKISGHWQSLNNRVIWGQACCGTERTGMAWSGIFHF